jgi:hypothetical protein
LSAFAAASLYLCLSGPRACVYLPFYLYNSYLCCIYRVFLNYSHKCRRISRRQCGSKRPSEDVRVCFYKHRGQSSRAHYVAGLVQPM